MYDLIVILAIGLPLIATMGGIVYREVKEARKPPPKGPVNIGESIGDLLVTMFTGGAYCPPPKKRE